MNLSLVFQVLKISCVLDDGFWGFGLVRLIILKNNIKVEGGLRKLQKLGYILGWNQNIYKNIFVKSQDCQRFNGF